MSEKLTNQTAFNLAWERAKDQRKCAIGTACFYRPKPEMLAEQPDLKGCFVGVMIPDSLAHDGATSWIRNNCKDFHDWHAFFSDCDMFLLEEVQRVHDAVDPSRWEHTLRDIAEKWNLKVPA